MDTILAVFDPQKAAGIPLELRVAAGDALGQAGDPRLRGHNWVRIPAGSFTMGEGDSAHEVYVDEYEIGRYPVTVEEYVRYVEEGGSEPQEWDKQQQHPNRPVVHVSWREAQEYCRWAGARLPTEAQWERAARGVEGRVYPWGNEDPDETRANYDKTGLGEPSPVGLFPKGGTPEGVGVEDLAGNVWEWVADWYADYASGGQRNPTGPASGELKVLRGGAWFSDATEVRTVYRFRFKPESRYNSFGFRCARELPFP
jgi:formylglycine-generating enzyme required for sulfatase activity